MRWRQFFAERFVTWWKDCGRESFDRMTGHKVKHFHGLVAKPYGRLVFIEGATAERVRISGVLLALTRTCSSERDAALLRRIAFALDRDDLVQQPPGKELTFLEFQQRDLVVLWMKENGYA